jgi:cysteine-rich CPXCG protein
MVLDLSVRRQSYVEDCEVCCNPIEVSYVSVRSAHLDEVWVGVEDDPMWTLTKVPTWGINGHFGAGSS